MSCSRVVHADNRVSFTTRNRLGFAFIGMFLAYVLAGIGAILCHRLNAGLAAVWTMAALALAPGTAWLASGLLDMMNTAHQPQPPHAGTDGHASGPLTMPPEQADNPQLADVCAAVAQAIEQISRNAGQHAGGECSTLLQECGLSARSGRGPAPEPPPEFPAFSAPRPAPRPYQRYR